MHEFKNHIQVQYCEYKNILFNIIQKFLNPE